MNPSRRPARLTVVAPSRRAEMRVVAPASVPVVNRQTLLDRLSMLGSLAPTAALSFLLVRMIDGPETVAASAGLAENCLVRLVRSTDTVGRLDVRSFGVVLQGADAAGAGVVAARVGHHLSTAGADGARLNCQVSIATGTGVNAGVLPSAAADSLANAG